MTEPIRLLLVEDNTGDVRLVREMLRDAAHIEIQVVDRLGSAVDHLRRRRSDVILLDLGLPDSQGMDTLRQLRRSAQGVPVVVLTGQADEESGRTAVQEGAQDYLVKDTLSERMLPRVLMYAVERHRYHEKFRSLFDSMAEGVFYQSADGTFADVNNAALDMFGLTREEFLSRTSFDPKWRVVCEDGSEAPGDTHPSAVALKTGHPVRNEVLGVFNPKRNGLVWLSVNAIPQTRTGETAHIRCL